MRNFTKFLNSAVEIVSRIKGTFAFVSRLLFQVSCQIKSQTLANTQKLLPTKAAKNEIRLYLLFLLLSC